MSDLSNIEKRKIERDLDMASGYVLDFSNRTFSEFMYEVANVDIYDERYEHASGSKANRLRAFWEQESNYAVAQVLEALHNDWEEYAGFSAKPPSESFTKVILRLKDSAPVPEINVIQPNAEDKSFESLARAVRDAIEHNKPLHSLVGEYIKAIKANGLIESEITERILKSTISVMEAFNKIRNDHSFAHDNVILNYDESLLIYGHVTSSIRFIEAIEKPKIVKNEEDLDDIPF